MVAIPTAKDEDAKRPNRERESLVGEQNRIINRMKAALIRLGIRGFNPKLKKAAGRLKDLRTLRASRSRRTRWLSYVATWSADGWSVLRSGRSRRHAWGVSSRRPAMDHMPWCACWRA